jgi:hypothetical protein
MNRAIAEAILQGVVPTAVFGVAAAGHRAVIPDVGKGIGAARRIAKKHRIGAESALTTEGQRTEVCGRYTGIEFVIKGLARARAVDGYGIAAPGKAVVGGLGGRSVGEQAGLRIDASGSARCLLYGVSRFLLTALAAFVVFSLFASYAVP